LCPLIFLPCICFVSVYASTAAKSYILNYMWTAANFIIKGRRLCTDGVVESTFTFSFSPITQLSQYHRPSARSKSLSPCSVKTPQYRIRKCVHEGRPRARNRSRVNPITVQYKVGNCGVTTIMLCNYYYECKARLQRG